MSNKYTAALILQNFVTKYF